MMTANILYGTVTPAACCRVDIVWWTSKPPIALRFMHLGLDFTSEKSALDMARRIYSHKLIDFLCASHSENRYSDPVG